MISGANEEELDIAIDTADLLLKIEQQKRTIQYLSECINEKDGLIISYRDEIDRLNNIIDELEKWLEESAKWEPYVFNGILDKLKELKEGK